MLAKYPTALGSKSAAGCLLPAPTPRSVVARTARVATTQTQDKEGIKAPSKERRYEPYHGMHRQRSATLEVGPQGPITEEEVATPKGYGHAIVLQSEFGPGMHAGGIQVSHPR